MYADDSTMYSTASTCSDLNNLLGIELKAIADWVNNNKLVLNIAKTKAIVFGSRYMLSSNPQLNLTLAGQPVEQVKETKLLGMVLDSGLKWTKQIDSIIIKMGRSIAVTRKCTKYLTPTVLKEVIQALVLSNLEYCPVIWSSAAKTQIQKLQIAQNKAARLALHCSKRTHIVDMHRDLSWLSVEKRLQSRVITFFRNVQVDKKPQYFYDQITYTKEKHEHMTRQATSGHLLAPKPRTNLLKSSVTYRAIMEWNSLPGYFAEIKSKTTFKKKLKYHLLASM